MKRTIILCVTFLFMFLLGTSTMAGGNSNMAVDVGEGFVCGKDLTCDPAVQYCYVLIGGPKGVPAHYSCVDMSAEGTLPTCETIPNIGIGCECTESEGGITVTCTAP